MLKRILSLSLISISLFSVSCGSKQETIEIENIPCKHYLYAKERLKVDPDTFETYKGIDYYDFQLSNYPIDKNERVFKDSEGRYYYFVDNCTLDH